jgi:uncharacterized protein
MRIHTDAYSWGATREQATIARMNTSDSARSLDESELARLDELLAQAHPEHSMMLEEYDGFCAALACSPTPISADESLPVVLGAEPGSALGSMSEGDRSELLTLLGRHRRAVARRLYEGEAWNAVIGTDESGRALGDAWAIGFLRGMELHPDDWGMLDEDEVCEEAFELILRFASEAGAASDAQAEGEDAAGRSVERLDEEPFEPIEDGEREEMIDLMLEGVSEIFDRLAPAREQALKPATIRRDGPRPGRNDPCHCGSGRKYKHCHGAG